MIYNYLEAIKLIFCFIGNNTTTFLTKEHFGLLNRPLKFYLYLLQQK